MTTARQNPFMLFHLPPVFDLDIKALEAEYLRLSREFHPDFHMDKSGEEQADLAREAAELNEAYRDLRDVWVRAEILLQILASDAPIDTKATPPGFLVSVLQETETLEEWLASGNAKNLEAAKKTYERKLESLLASLRSMFSDLHKLQGGEKARMACGIQVQLNQRRYYQNLIDKIEGKERDQRFQP